MSVGQRYEVPGKLTKPEFMLITLSQLPALSILLKGSMATPPGHVSLFAITNGRYQWQEPGVWCCYAQPGSLPKVKKGGNFSSISGVLRLWCSHKYHTAINSSADQLVNVTIAAINIPGLHWADKLLTITTADSERIPRWVGPACRRLKGPRSEWRVK